MSRTVSARGIVSGKAQGPALVAAEPVSFLGDVDIRSGRIVGDLPSARNASVRGTVLVFPYTSGSAGAWRFLQLLQARQPSGGADHRSGARPLRGPGRNRAGIPIVCAPAEPLDLTNGTTVEVEVEGDSGVIRILD